MEYAIFIIAFLVIGIIISFREADKENKARKNAPRNPNFHPDIYLDGFGGKYIFEVDKIKKLAKYTRGNNSILIPFKNIINAELSQDGNNISQKASYVKIYVSLRNMDITTLTIDCYHVPFSVQVSTTGMTGLEYRESLEKAQSLINVIRYIVDDNKFSQQTPSPAPAASPIQQSSVSIADELQKLHKLKSEGILTEEEFEAQKQKLLAQ